jgi:hypothetical protein
VIFRQPISNQAPAMTGGLLTVTALYYILTFNDSGTIKWGI